MKIDKNPYVELELPLKSINLIIDALNDYKRSDLPKEMPKLVDETLEVLRKEIDNALSAQPGYYLDKSIPLQKRWEAFSNTSNKYEYIPTIKTSFTKDLVQELWRNDSGEVRNRSFSLFGEVEEFNYLTSEGDECKWTREQVEEMMEAVMKSGYTDFIWNW